MTTSEQLVARIKKDLDDNLKQLDLLRRKIETIEKEADYKIKPLEGLPVFESDWSKVIICKKINEIVEYINGQ